ncbi:MAG TPA: nitronate monooxygenase family protein [Burkholderiaceae bacterium]|nr:nitronate monooxygenase family protein [Burkholderiaceae bacterium]
MPRFTLSTPLSRRLGLAAPIFQAPMAGGPTTPELVLAVGRAGALGAFGFAYTEPAQMRSAVERVRAQADVPIHINLFVEPAPPVPSAADVQAAARALEPAFSRFGLSPPQQLSPPWAPDPSAQIEAALALKPAVLSFHFNVFADDVTRAAHERGILVGGAATTPEEAEAIEAAGADFVIAQGAEAGGHRGTFHGAAEPGMIGLMALTRLIVARTNLPVVAAGGIMDGAGLAAALALGAQAVQMGTAFLACTECGAHSQHKRALKTHSARGTVVTNAFSGRAARAIRNDYVEFAQSRPAPVLPFPIQNKLTAPLRTGSAQRGDPAAMALYAGQAFALAREEPAGALIERCMRDAQQIVATLASGQ